MSLNTTMSLRDRSLWISNISNYFKPLQVAHHDELPNLGAFLKEIFEPLSVNPSAVGECYKRMSLEKNKKSAVSQIAYDSLKDISSALLEIYSEPEIWVKDEEKIDLRDLITEHVFKKASQLSTLSPNQRIDWWETSLDRKERQNQWKKYEKDTKLSLFGKADVNEDDFNYTSSYYLNVELYNYKYLLPGDLKRTGTKEDLLNSIEVVTTYLMETNNISDIRHFPLCHRENESIVWTAFLRRWSSLQFAAPSLLKSPDFIKKCVLEKPVAIQYADPILHNDIFLSSCLKNIDNDLDFFLRYFSQDFKKNAEKMLDIIELDPLAITQADQCLLDDAEFRYQACLRNSRAMSYLSIDYLNDDKLLKACSITPGLLYQTFREMKILENMRKFYEDSISFTFSYKILLSKIQNRISNLKKEKANIYRSKMKKAFLIYIMYAPRSAIEDLAFWKDVLQVFPTCISYVFFANPEWRTQLGKIEELKKTSQFIEEILDYNLPLISSDQSQSKLGKCFDLYFEGYRTYLNWLEAVD